MSPTEKLTDTIERQLEVENSVQDIYDDILEQGSDKFPPLHRKAHLRYTNLFLHRPLTPAFSKLDASHPWIIYWLLNATLLLGGTIDSEVKSQVATDILSYVVEDEGGIGGGYGQLSHLASTYAGLLSLVLIGDKEDFQKLDRTKIYRWLLSLKRENGSFSMHLDGEADCRAVYCALCIASMLDIIDDELIKGTADWLASCQTYEGGFSGEPSDEAHGGYTYCAIASLCILFSPSKVKELIDVDSLVRWTASRQYPIEGGLSGRTNKLVDGCYSHWVGGMSALLECVSGERQVLRRVSLQNYILCCCQGETFGLIDKPGCAPDFYHTNYVLCGLSMCQYYQVYDEKKAERQGCAFGYRSVRIGDGDVVDNFERNKVLPMDPIFGVPEGYVDWLRATRKD
ncbi:DEKNAAC101603 [Brettanomyces naardenensis]|uniref:Protein farnesyltransferase subunit beta n=1 Tax=Brettanomyces naardenensis TaxID=13370 RepID=A0A448YIL0_BRENA|nr:DEKNAAC101603 [Brettanomyces naardenensis]